MSSGFLSERLADPWVERLGRAGFVAKAVIYGVVAILAFKVARGAGGESPDKGGALKAIAEQPFGRWLLVLLALGLAAYALWRLAQAIFDRENEGEGPKGLAKRAGQLARAGWYAALCGLTVTTAFGKGGGSGNEQQQTAGVFDLPAGRYLVYGLGIAFAVAAGFNLWRAATCKFNDKLKTGQMGAKEETAATAIGVVGHGARGIVFGLIALFLLRAAWQVDPKEARGLDGALREVAQAPWGGSLLTAVAAGLFSYALYCLVQARYRDL